MDLDVLGGGGGGMFQKCRIKRRNSYYQCCKFLIIFGRGDNHFQNYELHENAKKIKLFSPDFVEMATILACNASAKLSIVNRCCVRMRSLFHCSASF